ncbi:MAG TPA: hypothetical protein VMS17_12030 [Gemmataceae bacterium]|nr:hypothetical protein [Gemmataceae bacterium]
MSKTTRLKPGHKANQQYHAALQTYSGQHVEHEGALETAFQRLLADTARDLTDWTLIPKQSMKVGGRTVIPDGTLRDEFLRRGYWEAKDTHDDLDAEIRKKIDKGYPLSKSNWDGPCGHQSDRMSKRETVDEIACEKRPKSAACFTLHTSRISLRFSRAASCRTRRSRPWVFPTRPFMTRTS